MATFLPLETLPLGFRFRPTDEVLINHYLKRRISGRISAADATVVPDVDVCRFEPWDLPGRSIIRSSDPEWFFFAPRDRKYANGRRSNRATAAGYWKATGKDRFIRTTKGKVVVGMKKTLVFHRGRAPKWERTEWIMHEYRTVEPEFELGDQGGFVLCRLFRKCEEKIPGSIVEEAETSGLSLAVSRSSPDDTLHVAEALEESVTPRNHEFLESHQQPFADVVDNQPAGLETVLANREDSSTSCPLKQDESHCNSNTSNVGDHDIDGIDLLEEHQIPENEPTEFPNISSPMQPFLDFTNQGSYNQCPDKMFEWDSVAEFLDAVLIDPEEFSPEMSELQIQTAIEFEPNGQFSTIRHDMLSGKTSEMSNYVDTEALITQGMFAPEDSWQFFSPSLFLSDSSEMHMYQSKHALDPSWIYSCRQMESTMDMWNNNERSVCKLNSNLSNDTEESSGHEDPTGSGIKIRNRQHSNNQASSQQGMAARRIHLQRSVEGPADVTETGIQIGHHQHPDYVLTSTDYLAEQGMAARSNDEFDSSENEAAVKPVTTKAKENVYFAEDEELSSVSDQYLLQNLSFDDGPAQANCWSPV